MWSFPVDVSLSWFGVVSYPSAVSHWMGMRCIVKQRRTAVCVSCVPPLRAHAVLVIRLRSSRWLRTETVRLVVVTNYLWTMRHQHFGSPFLVTYHWKAIDSSCDFDCSVFVCMCVYSFWVWWMREYVCSLCVEIINIVEWKWNALRR